MSYQIIKENLKDPSQKVYMICNHSEVLEFDTIEEAQNFCNILNANATDSKYYVKIHKK